MERQTHNIRGGLNHSCVAIETPNVISHMHAALSDLHAVSKLRNGFPQYSEENSTCVTPQPCPCGDQRAKAPSVKHLICSSKQEATASVLDLALMTITQRGTKSACPLVSIYVRGIDAPRANHSLWYSWIFVGSICCESDPSWVLGSP